MKLITDKGELALPQDFEFTIEQKSPFFSGEGTTSIPATIPATMDTLSKLGHPQRLGSREKFMRRIPAKLDAGVFQKIGQLIVDSVSSKEGITAALSLNESNVYTQFKDKNIRDLFAGHIANDYRAYATPVQSLYEYLYSIYIGEATDNFALFPVGVGDIDDRGICSVNNEPNYVRRNAPTYYTLLWKARVLTEGSDKVKVPDGYGISPFLYLGKFISLLFTKMGYTVTTNPFNTDSLLSKIVLLNNTSDTICLGYIDYSDLVPTVTVSDFITCIENKFHAFFIISPETKTVTIKLMEDTLNSSVDADSDLTAATEDSILYQFSDPQHINLVSETSLPGAEPAAETIEDLYSKYPIITSLSEAEWSDRWKYSVVLRKSTGGIYRIEINDVDNYSSTNPPATILIGSNYFSYNKRKTDNPQEIKAIDVSPPMMKPTNWLVPYIGERRHRHTSYNGNSEDEDQKILFAYAAGRDAGRYDPAHYFYGTTQKYNDRGSAMWCAMSLTPDDMYSSYWKRYNEMIMNNTTTIQAKVNFTLQQLLSMDITLPKNINSQKFLIKGLSYNIGRVLRNNASEFLLIKEYPNTLTDSTPIFTEQVYRWQLNLTQVTAAIAAAQPSVDGYVGKWTSEHFDPSEDKFSYPPAALGQTMNFQSIEIVIDYYYRSNEIPNPNYQTTVTVDIWYTAVAIE